MKHLMSGAAIAAPFAIVGPWAANGTDTQLATASSVSNPPSATPPKQRHARIHRPAARSSTTMHHHTARSSRSMADQLNQQEVSRLQAGACPRALCPGVECRVHARPGATIALE
jgi:hypothetical protein